MRGGTGNVGGPLPSGPSEKTNKQSNTIIWPRLWLQIFKNLQVVAGSKVGGVSRGGIGPVGGGEGAPEAGGGGTGLAERVPGRRLTPALIPVLAKN